ncbi:hypothetical protein Gogos_011040 [Gossypium gossypioides]|uniref:Uncharacterized protein n=1 Tax=Gossypium gossypioides TaxID=34282 RepID=A0A7J9BN17_GOSGO|nr:hypothetical protein [Gossypium gossypioides]
MLLISLFGTISVTKLLCSTSLITALT